MNNGARLKADGGFSLEMYWRFDDDDGHEE